MNIFSNIKTLIPAILLNLSLAGIAMAQNQSVYTFVVFETTVTQKGVETSDAHPQERRFYVSSIVEFTENDPSVERNASKIADNYFTATVVKPLEAKGILHQYYDDAIHMNDGVVYRLDTKADVEEVRQKAFERLKNMDVNVFSFTWDRTKGTMGLEDSKPVLIAHNPEQPLYGYPAPKAPVKPETPAKPAAKRRTP